MSALIVRLPEEKLAHVPLQSELLNSPDAHRAPGRLRVRQLADCVHTYRTRAALTH
jgi:hypothetical protein